MIYTNNEDYKVKFYQDKDGICQVINYIDKLSDKDRAKVLRYIEFLRVKKGYLEEPYSKHIDGKIRELRVDFGRNRHRIFYFLFIKKTIILLRAFLKKTDKTPLAEIKRAKENYNCVIETKETYE